MINFTKKIMKQSSHLFIYSNGRVAAINRKTGDIVWEIKIKEYIKGGFSYSYGQISVEDNKIFLGTSGILLCLSTKDGSLIWKNELKGWGYGFVSLANAGDESAIGAAAASSAAVIAAS
jgi:outer membrane protein assembly factor BamB